MSTTNYQNNLDYAVNQDAQDSLNHLRDLYHIPVRNNKEVIYFCGNSLGLQPKSTTESINSVTEDWKELAVEGHFRAKNPWMLYHDLLRKTTAKLVGALPVEVTVMNTLTVNLHFMMISFYNPNPKRFKIIMEAGSFPSDRYAVVSQIQFHGYNVDDALIEIAPREGESTLRNEDILAVIEQNADSLALVMFAGINYYTGQVFDMQAIAQKAKNAGANVGFDLAHGIGNIPLNLHDWNVDFAVWCNYKYVNGGPGTLGGCFVHEKYAEDSSLPRLAGWYGNNIQTRFLMGPDFDPSKGAEGWVNSTTPVYAMAPLKASLSIFEGIDLNTLFAKSKHLTGYLRFLIQEKTNLKIITPEHAGGCQLSLELQDKGKDVFNQLIDAGVICDWREPRVIRVAPTPMYNTYQEVFQFSEILQAIMNQ